MTDLWEQAHHPDANVRFRVAGNPDTPPDIIERLINDPDDDVAWAVGHCIGRDPSVYERLLHHPAVHVRVTVAGNLDTPASALREAAERDSDIAVRGALASNPACPSDVLATLADPDTLNVNDRDHVDLAYHLANNPNAPAEVLTRLHRHPNPRVRACVARNRHTPPATLAILAETATEGETLLAVAGNPSTPADTFTVLLTRGDGWTAGAVAGNPSTPEDVLRYLVSASVGSFPGPAITSDHMGFEPDEWHLRVQIAGNPAAPADVLTDLAGDREQEVLEALLANPSTPELAAVEAHLALGALDL